MDDHKSHGSKNEEMAESDLLTADSVKVLYSTDITNSKVVPTTSQAETLSEIQGLFTESQKIAYVGLCYCLMFHFKKTRFPSTMSDKRALVQYEKWSLEYMEKIFVYLDFTTKERNLIQNLAFHGAQPKDLASSLIKDAKDTIQAAELEEKLKIKIHQDALDAGIMVPSDALLSPERPRDIRFVILSHMFLLSISDGFYDARSRALVKSIAKHLEISLIDTIRVEFAIADQLRISVHEGEQFKHAETVVGERNKIETRNRYLFAGLATLAGGAVIGLTAGIAAPFIGAGIGATLTTFGVTGAAGVGSFMASAGGLALITTGGVLTGGGMSGVKMMKRTRGVQEFEFVSIDDAMKLIMTHREERRLQKKKKAEKGSIKEPNDEKKVTPKDSSTDATADIPEDTDSRRNSKAYINPLYKNTELWVKAVENSRTSSYQSMDSELNLINSAQASICGESPAVSSVPTKGSLWVENPESCISSHSYVHENPLARDASSRQTNVLITVGGWVYHDADEHSLPFSVLERNVHGDQYTLIWETETLLELGQSLKIVVSEIASFIVQQGIQALILPALMAALTGPLWMLKLSYLIDNPWGNGLTKAEKTGKVLADTLLGQVQGNRPVTLVGYSLGARVIYYCLEELASKGAFGIVEDVYLFGCPVLVELKQWQNAAIIVSGRIFNGYCPNDSILAILYRASASSWSDVAGLQPILGVEGVENVNLEEVVKGHTEYYSKLPLVLEKCGFSISDIFFEDEEDMEEQDLIASREQKLKINEKKLREKEERLKKRQQKYQEKLLNQQEEADRQLAQKLKEEALKIMQQDSGKESENQNAISEKELWFEPKELKGNLPPLMINLNHEKTPETGSLDLDSSLSEAGLYSLVGNIDPTVKKQQNDSVHISNQHISERKTDFEYISDSEDEKIQSKNQLSLKMPDSTTNSFFGNSTNVSPITEPSPTHTRVRHKSNNAASPDVVRKFT